MPIDLIISPELEVAKSIARQIQSPGAYDVAPFIEDKIQLINIVINENCPLIDTELKNIHELFQEDTIESKNLRATIVGIERKDKLFIPDKSDKLLEKDTVYLLTDRSHLDRAVSAFGIDENLLINNYYWRWQYRIQFSKRIRRNKFTYISHNH